MDAGRDFPPATGDPAGRGWRPASGTAGGPLPAEPDRGGLSGQVRSLQQRTEFTGQGQGRQVVTFRLERHDAAGNRLQPVPVELRGTSFRGSLNDGDWVQVQGRQRGGTIYARAVRNLTTGGAVKVSTRRFVTVLAIILMLAIVVGGAIVAFSFFGSGPGIVPKPIHDAPVRSGLVLR